ncbi:hypothetical protein RRG08_001069 [Elysia crispata]|uniref:Uncharacterized protein n=1 Tax=Elysia crispata TaxID=231223 RepID=A0AAE1AXY0_9GAST|nr:hypothetical protein RRG08_001069 [Elysia crispata]
MCEISLEISRPTAPVTNTLLDLSPRDCRALLGNGYFWVHKTWHLAERACDLIEPISRESWETPLFPAEYFPENPESGCTLRSALKFTRTTTSLLEARATALLVLASRSAMEVMVTFTGGPDTVLHVDGFH